MVPSSTRNWIAINAVQQSNLIPKKDPNLQYDKSTLKKIKRPVASAARFPPNLARGRLPCIFADRSGWQRHMATEPRLGRLEHRVELESGNGT